MACFGAIKETILGLKVRFREKHPCMRGLPHVSSCFPETPILHIIVAFGYPISPASPKADWFPETNWGSFHRPPPKNCDVPHGFVLKSSPQTRAGPSQKVCFQTHPKGTCKYKPPNTGAYTDPPIQPDARSALRAPLCFARLRLPLACRLDLCQRGGDAHLPPLTPLTSPPVR